MITITTSLVCPSMHMLIRKINRQVYCTLQKLATYQRHMNLNSCKYKGNPQFIYRMTSLYN